MADEIDDKRVAGWILKHACKYHMDTVIHQIFSNETKTPVSVPSSTITNVNLYVSNISKYLHSDECIYPVLGLCWTTILNLKDPLIHENTSMMTTVVELLEHIYSYCKTVSLTVFMKLIHKIKLMVLVEKIRQGDPSAAPLLNEYFPNWSEACEVNLKCKYKITNSNQMQAIRRNYWKCRMAVLGLMMKKQKILDCYKEFKEQMFSSLISSVEQDFLKFWEGTTSKIRPTEIDQILGGKWLEFESSANPAVLILLDCLKADHCNQTSNEHTIEKALLNALQFLINGDNPMVTDLLTFNSLSTTSEQTESSRSTLNGSKKLPRTQFENFSPISRKSPEMFSSKEIYPIAMKSVHTQTPDALNRNCSVLQDWYQDSLQVSKSAIPFNGNSFARSEQSSLILSTSNDVYVDEIPSASLASSHWENSSASRVTLSSHLDTNLSPLNLGDKSSSSSLPPNSISQGIAQHTENVSLSFSSDSDKVLAVPCLEKHLPDFNLKPCLIMFQEKKQWQYDGKLYDLYL